MYLDAFTIIIWTLRGTLSPYCYFSHTPLVFSHYCSILPLPYIVFYVFLRLIDRLYLFDEWR